MARYREKVLPLSWTLAVLGISFLIFFAPWKMGERELYWNEGYAVAQALDMTLTPLPLVQVHGEAIPNAFPLQPMLLRGIHALGLSMELSLRWMNLVALAALVALVFVVTRRIAGLSGAGVAAALLIGCNLVIDKSIFYNMDYLLVLLVFSAHLSWYYYAAIRSDWDKAYVAGLGLAAIGFYACGMAALLFFALPLLFLRRPLGIFSRLRRPGLALGGALVLVSVLLWYLPYCLDGVNRAEQYFQFGFLNLPEYLCHLLIFPWDAALRLLPWTLLAWAPFCVAFQPLDPVPVFSRFLRTLTISMFFLLWLRPVDQVCDLMLLLPALAIQTGIRYSLLVRRYGNFFQKLLTSLTFLLPILGAGIILFFTIPGELLALLLHLERPVAYAGQWPAAAGGLAAGALLIVEAAVLLRSKVKPPIWAYILLLTWAPMLFFWTIAMPYRIQDGERRQIGAAAWMALQQDGAQPQVEVYKYEFNDLFAEGYYMNARLLRLPKLEALPGKEKQVIYLISPSFPQAPERNWKKLLENPPEIRGKKMNLWRGEWNVEAEKNTPANGRSRRRRSAPHE